MLLAVSVASAASLTRWWVGPGPMLAPTLPAMIDRVVRERERPLDVLGMRFLVVALLRHMVGVIQGGLAMMMMVWVLLLGMMSVIGLVMLATRALVAAEMAVRGGVGFRVQNFEQVVDTEAHLLLFGVLDQASDIRCLAAQGALVSQHDQAVFRSCDGHVQATGVLQEANTRLTIGADT